MHDQIHYLFQATPCTHGGGFVVNSMLLNHKLRYFVWVGLQLVFVAADELARLLHFASVSKRRYRQKCRVVSSQLVLLSALCFYIEV